MLLHGFCEKIVSPGNANHVHYVYYVYNLLHKQGLLQDRERSEMPPSTPTPTPTYSNFMY